MEVNGKFYSLWGQFVERQQEFIGGILEDRGDNFDRAMGLEPRKTAITGIELRPNGDDSAFFCVKGKDFDCGFDVEFGGVGAGEDGWITFNGYGGHIWGIQDKNKNE